MLIRFPLCAVRAAEETAAGGAGTSQREEEAEALCWTPEQQQRKRKGKRKRALLKRLLGQMRQNCPQTEVKMVSFLFSLNSPLNRSRVADETQDQKYSDRRIVWIFSILSAKSQHLLKRITSVSFCINVKTDWDTADNSAGMTTRNKV